MLITLEVGDKTALFILLAKDGNIHRKGNGNVSRTNLPLKAAISHQGHFDALMMTISEDIFNFTGVINKPGRVGTECRLSIIFLDKDDNDYPFRVIYGSESEGPPQELAAILINAVKITDGWYSEESIQPEAGEKKWWKIW
ncbi:MAG TPA: hypothetical protein VG603_09270 [Chitinophagales bacterium]|nr:hypothetical protein [Chitinophagales bacterium]